MRPNSIDCDLSNNWLISHDYISMYYHYYPIFLLIKSKTHLNYF